MKIHQPASQGHPRTRRDAELSSTWDLLKDVAAAAPDIQQHQVEVPGFQQRLMSSASASSRAGLNSPLPQSAPQCCCPAPKPGDASHRAEQKRPGIVTGNHSTVPVCSPQLCRTLLCPSHQVPAVSPPTVLSPAAGPPSFSPCHSTPPRHPR